MALPLTRRESLLAIASCASAGAFGASGFCGPLQAANAVKTEPPKWLSLPATPPLPETKDQGLLAVNATRIFYAQFGAGPSVVLLHGGLGNSSYWGAQIAELSKSFRVTAIDTRGHGRSPLMSGAMSYRLFAQDVREVTKALGIAKTAIVGWSDGAITGLELAMNDPGLVSGLFAFGANTTPSGLIAGGTGSAVFREYSRRARREYAALSPTPKRWPDLSSALDRMWQSEPNYTAADLARIACHVTVSDGEHDEVIRQDHTRQIAHSIPGAELVIQKDVSHFAMLQDPDQFTAALTAFLSKLS